MILTASQGIFWLLRINFSSLRLYQFFFYTIQCLKCIIKYLYQFVFTFGQLLDFKLTYFLNYWWLCDSEHFFILSLALFVPLCALCGYIIVFGHYTVLEMYYIMFVPICLQVWTIFRLRIDIFAELLAILWFSPPHGAFFDSQALFFPLWGYINKFGH